MNAGRWIVAGVVVGVMFPIFFAGVLFLAPDHSVSGAHIDQWSPGQSADKREALSRAKEIGMAILMYAVDSNDEWPAFVSESNMGPYTGSTSLDGFVYERPLFQKTTETPPDQEIGRITLNDGAATVNAKGDSLWIPKP
jgi:hypothetical protein